MSKKELIILNIEEHPTFTLEEICLASQSTHEFIEDMIEHGVLTPEGFSIETWQFDSRDLQRVRKALNLQRDLEVNLAGIALILDLLDEMEKLHQELHILKSKS